MAAALDIKENARISRDKNGYRVDRIAIVTGVTGTASQRLYNAINDIGLPNYGDVHPDIAGIYLNDITADVIDPETVRVTMSYYNDPSDAEGGETSVRVSAGTTIEEVTTDILGAAMETEYTVTEEIFNWTTVKPTFTADVEIPRLTFDFETTSATLPKTSMDTYHGKINSAIWNGYAIGTILCAAVNIDQQGDEFKIRYSFIYNADTWKFLAKVPDAPGNIASTTDLDLDILTGIKEFDVYESVDFTPLGFTL